MGQLLHGSAKITHAADDAYDRLKLMDKAAYPDFVVEIIRRRDGAQGFEVLPAPLGRGVNLRLDDPLAPSCAAIVSAALTSQRPCSSSPWAEILPVETHIREFPNGLLEEATHPFSSIHLKCSASPEVQPHLPEVRFQPRGLPE